MGAELKLQDSPLIIDLEYICAPKEQNSAPTLSDWHLSAIDSLSAGRILEKHPAGTVCWMTITTQAGTEEQLLLMATTLKELFL